MKVNQILNERYYEIIKKHNNPIWAREELEYLVRIQSWWFQTLSEADQQDVHDYFSALKLVHGGN